MKASLIISLSLATLVSAQPPKGWMKLPWEEKEKVLTGHFSPKGKELSEMEAVVDSLDKGDYEKEFKVLLMYRCGGFAHNSIGAANKAVELMGEKTGAFQVTLTDKYEDLEYENLSQFDVVLFNNTTRLGMSKYPKSQEGLVKFLQDGKGYAGLHAASDTFYDWPEGQKIVGGLFAGHPWNAGHTWAFKLETPDHPVLGGFGGNGFWHKDEIYQYAPEHFDRDRSRVLISLDFSEGRNLEKANLEQAKGVLGDDVAQYDVPVSWVHEYGKGRVFYTNFGHNIETFRQQNILQHIYDGLQYASGNLKADAMPSGKLEKVQLSHAPALEKK